MSQKQDDDNILEKIGMGAKKIWNKTVFPDIIKEKKAKKAEEKLLRQEARREALIEAGPLLKEKYKQEEINKILSKKTGDGWADKLAKGFGAGNGQQKSTGTDMSKKITDAFSLGGGGNGSFSDDRISKMLGGTTNQPRKGEKVRKETPEEKIKRMIG